MAGRWDQQTRTKTAKAGSLLLIEQDPDLVGRADRGITVEDFAGQYRNALATQGGLVGDGTADCGGYSTLGAPGAIGADPFSLVMKFSVPATTPTASTSLDTIGSSLSSGGANGSFSVRLLANAGAVLDIILTNSSAGVLRYTYDIVANFGGKEVIMSLVRNTSGEIECRINVTQITLTKINATATAQDALTATYYYFGRGGNANRFLLRSRTLYNLALSAADILEIYEGGGAVPERFKFGSQVERIVNVSRNGDFSAGATDWAGGTSGVSAGKLQLQGAAQYSLSFSHWSGLPRGRTMRITCDIVSNATGQDLGFSLGTAATGSNTIGGSGVGKVFTLTNVDSSSSSSLYVAANFSTSLFELDNIFIKQLGAICHFDGDSDGIGYQWHDQSTNKLDAVITTTGVTWTKPQRRGYVRGTLTWAGTHEAKSLIGQRALPDGAVMQLLTLKATAATSGSGCTVGSTTTAARWRAAAALAANTKTVATLANQLPAGTANNDTDLVIDPDTANFTGDIAVEAHYALTEGT